MASANASAGEWIDDVRGNERFVFSIAGMYVYVYEGSITSVQDVDAITNATNTTLALGAGIAQHIARKAGSSLADECKDFVNRNGPVEVTQNFISGAGNLRFRGIINAVGPQWNDYAGRQADCARDLCYTVINVLMSVRAEGWISVAIPAISSGRSGVPRQLCAEMYIKALADFAESGPEGLREVHIVDMNREMIEQICEAQERWYDNPQSISFRNAENYPGPTRGASRRDDLDLGHVSLPAPALSQMNVPRFQQTHQNVGGRQQQRKPGSFSGFGEDARYKFKVSDLTVYVYRSSLTETSGMDAITNSTVAKLEHGCGVALEISKAAGDDMNRECTDHVRRNGEVQVTHNYVSSPGRLNCQGIVHAVGPQWHWYEDRRSECARDLHRTVINVLVTVKQRNWRTVALSAIGSQHSGIPQKLCVEMCVKAITEFAERGRGSVKEVHFIDIDQKILELVVAAHKEWVKDPNSLDFNNANSY